MRKFCIIMVNKDYYNILGVERNAGVKDIHQAYRRKARELHPDKNKSDPKAEDKFKELGEAYRILSDPEKRKQYDLFGSVGGDYAPPPGWGDAHRQGGSGSHDEWEQFQEGGLEDIFDRIFQRFTRGPDPRFHRAGIDLEIERGSDIEVELPVGVEDLFQSRVRQIRISTTRPCSKCQGLGRQGTRNCAECSGMGRVTRRKTIKLRLPLGLSHGDVIRLPEQGNPPPGGLGPAGDLFVRLKVKPHPRYSVSGYNLEVKLEVPDYVAALGGKVEFETPRGKMSLQLPSGTASNRKLKVRGKGLPKRNGGFGDLFVHITVSVPEALTKAQKELYKKLKKSGS